MIRRRLALAVVFLSVLITVAGAVLPGWADLGNWRWLVLGAGAVALLAAYVQDRANDGTAVPFTAADWTADPDGGHSMVIRRSRHGRRRPQASVWVPREDGTYEQVYLTCKTSGDDVLLAIGVPPFAGEVRIF